MKKYFAVLMLFVSAFAFAADSALTKAQKEWTDYLAADRAGKNIAEREVTRQKYAKEVVPYVDAAKEMRKKSTDPDEQNKLDYIIRKLDGIKNIKL